MINNNCPKRNLPGRVIVTLSRAWLAALAGLCLSLTAQGGGTWTALNNAPPSGLDAGLLLSDGTVICCNGGSNWYRLTPDLHGSYVNGSWSQIASMNYSRLFFSSDVLTNGNVYVAGGEYGGGPAELYSALSNTWTVIPPPSENFSDACSMVLPDGNVLQSDSQSGYVIYNAAGNLMTAGGSCGDMNETCWVRMPNDNILAVTGYSQTSEHYVPSLNAWYADNNVPVPVYGYGGELGAALVLPNGNVFQIGATNNTAIYTPGSTLTSAGSWVAGPQMVFGTNQLGGVDAPASMMITGNVLLCIGPVAGFDGPCSFYEYNWLSNTFTPENAPGGGTTYGGAPFGTSMLNLPDGTVLFVSGQGTTSLFVYAPSGAPLAAGQPGISSITENGDGSYQLTGVGLNGISGGSAYGDDWQMNTSYPLVRLTNSSSGDVYYGRTYNWSSTTIQSTNPVTTEFSLPAGLPAGTYSLVVTVMGNVSAATNFVYAPPAVPTGFTAASGSNAFVNLQWNASSGATSYAVKRSVLNGGYFATIAIVSGTNYTDAAVTNGETYYYCIAAIGSSGASGNSAAVSAIPFGPPSVPGGLTASSGGDAVVPLFWNPSFGASYYVLERSTTSGGPYMAIASLDATNFNDTGVVDGTTYYYVVVAAGPGGESQTSAQVFATPTAPTLITWLKADAIAGLTNGALVTGWNDSSQHGYDAVQITASHRPSYVTNAMNGLPVVRFNSAGSNYMSVTRAGSLDDDWTLLMVYQSTQTTQGTGTAYYQGAGLVNAAQSAGTANDFGTQLNATGQVTVGTGNPATSISSGAGYNDGHPHLVTFERKQSTGLLVLSMDGMQVASTNGGTGAQTAPPSWYLAAVPSGGGFLSGDIAEVKFYISALSPLDLALQEATLISKWGVSLPAAPGGLTAVAANGQVDLNWNAYPTATNYLLLRSTSSGGPYSVVGSTSGTNYVDATVVNGTTYYYEISAVTPLAQSSDSAPVSAEPQAPVLITWYRADAINGLASGAAVSAWLDLSGYGYTATQATSSRRPTYVTNAMNGRPVVRFNSANSTYMSFTRPVQNDWTMFIVYQSSQTNQGSGTAFYQGAGLVNGDQPGVANDYGTQMNALGQITVGTGNPDTSISSGEGYNTGQPHVVTFKRTESTGALALYVDGTEEATGTAGTNSMTAPPTLDLGAVPSGGGFLTGDIAEVMIFTSALSDTNRLFEEGYLECKYGLSGEFVTLATPGGVNGALSGSQVLLSWLGVSGAASYTVSSSTNQSGPFNLLASGLTAGSYTDTNAAPGWTNYYQITAVNMCNSSLATPAAGVFLPLAAPSGLAGTAGNMQISLTWGRVNGATGYNLWRSTDNGATYQSIALSLNTASYVDTNAANGQTNYYEVASMNNNGASTNSAPVGVFLPLTAPSGLTGTAGNLQISLTWGTVNGATGYNLWRSTDNGVTYQSIALGLTTASYVDTNAANGQTNYYEVASMNNNGASTNSVPVGVFLPLPALNVNTPDGVTLYVSWPGWASNWGLNYSTNLTPPISWLPVTNSEVVSSNQIIVTLPIGPGASFFELFAP